MRKCLDVLLVVSLALAAGPAGAQSATAQARRDAALRRLESRAGGALLVSRHRATGAARFVRVRPGSGAVLGTGPARTAAEREQQSAAFFRESGAAMGLDDPASLRLARTELDALGGTHLTWRQVYGSVPVFAGVVKTHFDAAGNLVAVTGTAIPGIAVSATPSWSAERAGAVAREAVVAARGASDGLGAGATTLYVFREGLAQGIPGESRLAWEVEVTDGARIRDLVYVDAHSGRVIARVNAIHDALQRRAFDGHDLAFAPPNYPNGAFWLEGQPFPTASQEANNMIVSSREVYELFSRAFGRDSFDDAGATMDAIFDRGYSCPNASWNGTFISFCPGTTTDDVTAHEWGHAFTEHTHGLIYEWQPGALNESYSDIWGEVVDLINGRGTDAPGGARSAGACSEFSPPVGQLVVTAPAAIAGTYFAQSAGFGPRLTAAGTSGGVVAALDAADAAGPSTTDGCSAITNAAQVAGRVALIRRGTCQFSQKVYNAQLAGAIAVLIDNNAATGLPGMGAGLNAELVTIPSLGIQQGTGAAIRAQLAAGTPVTGTLLAQPGTDASYRWLVAEDSAAFNGAIRDMANPACYANPGKVTDTAYYVCSTADGGGVHTNSGVPNHGFSLLVDGGTYNGTTVAPIGLTKAAHIYYRAQTLYQHPDTDFAAHADALEASCADLVGAPLNALTGGPSGESITAADCGQVASMAAAVELRTAPAFCNFAPLLNPALPALCAASTTSGVAQPIASFDFESDPASSWTATHTAASAAFTARDWAWVNALPSGRAGAGFFAADPNTTCAAGHDESGVLHLTSPEIALPATTDFARATFEHWMASEAGWDGGTLSVSVNGGPWQLVPPSEFTFNNYIAFLFTAADGNTNPLAGLPSWTGVNAGTTGDGSWGRTHVNLGNFAGPGDTVRLRWDFGTDVCSGRVGWYLDNVNVFSCQPNVPALSIADVMVVEGDAGRTDALFTVTLSQATIRPISVSFETVDDTAQHGNDFDGGTGTLVIPAGRTSGQIAVPVKGDIVREGDERFLVRLSGAANATIADGEAVATIPEDD